MKKLIYFLLVLFCIPFVVKAEDLEIIKMDTSGYYNGILYSNGDLQIYYRSWNDNNFTKKVISNVKDFRLNDEKIIYLTNDDVYQPYDPFDVYNDENTILNVREIVTVRNRHPYNNYYIDKNDDYYIDNKLIASNVKNVLVTYDTTLYLTNNNELYFIGDNYYGSKINSGNSTETPIKLLDNIVEFEEKYALNSEGDLYVFSAKDPRPTVYVRDVKKVLFYVDDYYFRKMIAIKNDNTNFYFNSFDNIEPIEMNLNSKKIVNNFILTEDNKLYFYNLRYSSNTHLLDTNVKDISYLIDYDTFLYLKNNNEVYHVSGNDWYEDDKLFYVNELVQRLFHGEKANKPVLYLKNVKSLDFMYCNSFLLNDNSLLRVGDGEDGVFFGEPYTYSKIPTQVNELINNNKAIKVNQINLSLKDIYDYTVGDEFDAYATAIPFNSVNKELVWSSSNTNVATVDSEGYVVTKAVGSTTITVKTTDNSVSESATINVYPKPSGITINNGESITIGKNEGVLLTAVVSPEDTLKKEITWEVLDKKEGNIDSDYLRTWYFDNELGKEIELGSDQRYFRTYNGGTYRVKVTTEDGNYNDIITINVIEKVSYIQLSIPEENYDGYSAFIFLFENDRFTATATVENENASNKKLIWSSSNTSVATVDQNGLVIGKKAGRAIITIASEDGGAKRTFNVIVYDQNGNTETITDKITSSPVVSVKNGNDNTLLVSWNEVSNTESYVVYQSTDNKKWTSIGTKKELSFTATNLTYGKKYYYKVKAQNSVSSKTSSVVNGKTYPNKVNNLVIKSAGTNNVKLGYDKVSVTGYEIYYSTDQKKWTKATTVTSSNTLEYNVKKLKENKKYYFKVRAYKKVSGSKVYGDYSSVVSTKTAPLKPKVTLSIKDYNAMSITIESVKGASVYKVEKGTDGKTYELVSELPGPGKLDQDEQNLGTTYYFRVKACNAENRCSGWVNVSLKQTPKTPKVTLVTTSKKVTITLGKVNGVQGYQIYSATKKNGTYKLLKEFSNEEELLEYVHKTTKGKTYYYKVRSFAINTNDSRVYSSYSSIKSIKSK